MKTIGLIGGLSFESSLEYYRIINKKINNQLGGLHSSKCIMYSVDFNEIASLQDKGDWGTITKIITEIAKKLKNAGAEFIVICTNTTHKIADNVQNHIDIPILHIVDTTAEKIKEMDINKIGLLGTKFTMEDGFYSKRLINKYNIGVIIPDEPDRQVIHQIIFGELVTGIIKESSRNMIKQIINKLISKGAKGVILGCTELPLLITLEDYTVPIFNTTLIHALSAAELSLESN